MNRAPRPGLGFAARLLAALMLVVAVGGLTAVVVVGAVGPRVFHEHMIQAGLAETESAVLHADAAFQTAGALALGVALAASVATSLVASALVSRRVAASLLTVSTAATRIAAGELDSRVENPRLGYEFDDLSGAFNDMAVQLADAHALRERLLADVAHELRTPVATLAAHLEGLEDGVIALTPATVAVLREQGDRLTRLAADLASVTRAERGGNGETRVAVAAHQPVDRACRALRDRFEAGGVALVTEVRAGVTPLPDVVVDLERMTQVFTNLLDNALRHTPDGGSVTVTIEPHGGHGVRFEVTDTGEGIGAEHLPHVFERFYRADTARDRTHGGSGIGLSIVRAIVLDHGGSVTAWSAGPGSGTSFQVTLPAGSLHDDAGDGTRR